jgi:hypothetical protein
VGTHRSATTLPTTSLAFLSPPITVNTIAGQSVVVSSQIALGTSSTTTQAASLRLWICSQSTSGGSISALHPIDWMSPKAAPTSLNVYSLTDTFTPATGQFMVGMCGQLTVSTNAWDQGDWSYTTAQVISGASILVRPGPEERPGRD